jgi:hypothetical protein
MKRRPAAARLIALHPTMARHPMQTPVRPQPATMRR